MSPFSDRLIADGDGRKGLCELRLDVDEALERWGLYVGFPEVLTELCSVSSLWCNSGMVKGCCG